MHRLGLFHSQSLLHYCIVGLSVAVAVTSLVLSFSDLESRKIDGRDAIFSHFLGGFEKPAGYFYYDYFYLVFVRSFSFSSSMFSLCNTKSAFSRAFSQPTKTKTKTKTTSSHHHSWAVLEWMEGWLISGQTDKKNQPLDLRKLTVSQRNRYRWYHYYHQTLRNWFVAHLG